MVSRRGPDRIDPSLWRRSDMRTALAERNIPAVFRLLQRSGVSQRRIAALTGQSQSEISEIKRGRQVLSYEVLVRIADGLGVPRGQLGLAYDDRTAALVAASNADAEDDAAQLSRLTRLAIGTATVDPHVWERPLSVGWGRPIEHVGQPDVLQLAGATARLRALDQAQGGGACRAATQANISWAQELLRARASAEVERELHAAVGDLHLLAGWAAFDIGLIGPARRHFTRGLEHARYVNEPTLVAKALYCLARVHMHRSWGGQAIRLLQLAQVAAQQSGESRSVAMVHANLAWAQALVGDTEQAMAETSRARDEFGRVADAQAPPWLRFFDSAELQALRGTALAYLPRPTPQQRAEAIERFALSAALRELPMTRSRAFELGMLAWMLADNGDADQAVRVGHQAVDLAERLRSQRVIDRLAPLRASLSRLVGSSDVRDLEARIDSVNAQSPPNRAEAARSATNVATSPGSGSVAADSGAPATAGPAGEASAPPATVAVGIVPQPRSAAGGKP